MKLMILGSGRHGKDYAADFICREWKYHSISSSEFVGRRAVFPATQTGEHQHRVPKYATFEECFSDRHSGDNRAFWYDMIQQYNADDPARLARELYESYDIYVGLRSAREFNAAKAQNLFDLSIWVDAFNRVPPEASTSLTITRDMADIVLDNSGTIDHFDLKLHKLMSVLQHRV